MRTSRQLVAVDGRTELDPNLAYIPPHVDQPVEKTERPFWSAVRRQRRTIVALIVAGLTLGLLLAYLTPRTYRAEAEVEFNRAATASTGDQSAGRSAEPAFSKEFIETQLGIIRSRLLAQKVAGHLNTGAPRIANALALPPAVAEDQDQLARRLREGVSAKVAQGSRVARIGFSSRDPGASAAVANAYVAAYIETNLQRQSDASLSSRKFLEQQLAQTKAKLDGAEKSLIDYTRKAGLIDPSAGTASVSGDAAPHSLASDNLGQLNQAYSQARADRIAAEQQWRSAQSAPTSSLPEVLNNPAVQQLTQKSAEAQAAYEQQRQHRLDSHPDVAAAAAQIAETKRQIATLGGSIKGSIRDRYEVARRQEGDLARTVQRLQSQTLADQGKGVEYNRLKREADSNRSLYSALLQRYNDATTAVGLVASDINLIDPAVAPDSPTSPKPLLWGGLGGAAGLMLGFLVAMISFVQDDQFRSPESVDTNLGLRVLGVLPRVKNPGEALTDLRSPLAEAHYALRGSLEAITGRGPPRSIVFTSSREGEGKTTAAFGAARDFALSGRRTLLIDGDMRKPAVQKHVQLSHNLGLSTVLADLSTPEAAIMRTDTPGLEVMLAGPMPASPAALLSGKQLNSLLRYLTPKYDVIIIDGPPVFGLVDVPRLAAAADYTAFVVEAGRAKIAEVRGALRRLLDFKAKVAGVVLTKFDIAKSDSPSDLYIYSYGAQPQRLEALEAQ